MTLIWLKETGGRGTGKVLNCAGNACDYEKYIPFNEEIEEIEQYNIIDIEKTEADHWAIEDYKGSCKK